MLWKDTRFHVKGVWRELRGGWSACVVLYCKRVEYADQGVESWPKGFSDISLLD